MLALCFPVLISLALAAPGVSRDCYIYCKSQKSELMKGDTPLECNCADLVDTVIEVKELSTTTLDDTGVYFVPAELKLFQGQFASQPFFISNPAKLVPKSSVTRINREFVATKDTPEALDDPMPSQNAHVEIHERTETISHTSINQEWGKSPLYLDLELEDSIDNERAAVQKSTFIDDFESTEQALVECLDYQVIQYTRKYGFIKEFKEFWEARNLNKYEHLPDIEIEEKIQEYCSKPEAIVQQSLHEIKQGLPKKVPDSMSDPEYVKKDREVNSTTKITVNLLSDVTGVGNYSPPITSTPLFDNATEISETLSTNTENYTLLENVTEQYDTTYDPTENWPFINFTPSSLLNEDNKYEIHQKSSSIETESDILQITTEISLIVDSQEKHVIPVKQAKGATERDAELDLDTMTSNTVYRTYVPTRQAELKTTNNAQILDKITSFLPISTTASSIEEPLGKETTPTEDISDVQLLNNNNTTQIVMTTAYSQVRNTFPEEEIKIPKITTKECRNNTVQSTVDGTEELPNNDFIDSTAAESGHFETRKRNSGNGNDITGKMYLVSKTELVPVRFVQTDTGAISLGIDGIALCDKLVRKTIKTSRLLTKLCDYVENV